MGVQTQLGMLSQVIKTVDPRLHQHLGTQSLLLSTFKLCFVCTCHDGKLNTVYSSLHNRGSGRWRVSVCYKDVDGFVQERVLLP